MIQGTSGICWSVPSLREHRNIVWVPDQQIGGIAFTFQIINHDVSAVQNVHLIISSGVFHVTGIDSKGLPCPANAENPVILTALSNIAPEIVPSSSAVPRHQDPRMAPILRNPGNAVSHIGIKGEIPQNWTSCHTPPQRINAGLFSGSNETAVCQYYRCISNIRRIYRWYVFFFFCKDSIRYLRNKDLRKSLCNTDQFCIFLQMKRVRNPITSFCLSIPYTCKMITPQEKAVKGELTAFFQYWEIWMMAGWKSPASRLKVWYSPVPYSSISGYSQIQFLPWSPWIHLMQKQYGA